MLCRGSEWHKWDLHVHTPSSVLRNDFGNDWDGYVQKLFRKAIEEDIRAIGITDYFSIDGYKKLKQDYLAQPSKLKELFESKEIEEIEKILIFPNIEFRLEKFVSGNPKDLDKLNRKLNYHVLLSDKIDIEDIEQNFLSQIQFQYNANTGEEAETRSLTRSNLESLGRRLKSEHSTFSSKPDIYIGMMCAAVDESKITKLLKKSIFKGKYLLGPNPDEDLSKVSWNSQGHNTRKNLIKQSHFMFSSNAGTIRFMKGQFHETERQFENEFGSLKPCLWGSDAHDFKSLFNPSDKRHTWIKSDLSFGGLKQVVYDPKSRVAIQELSPQNKPSYQTIKKVRFVDKRVNPEFADDWIPISKDLTTIIGGKSSGKSLLLNHIAKSINFDEVDENCKISHASMYSNFDKDEDFDFWVEWDNGEISKLRNRESKKPITYISQLYINHLSEDEGRNKLNSIIKDILSQHDEFKQRIDSIEHDVSEKKQEVFQHIGAYYSLRDAFKDLKKDLDKVGNKDSIASEIKSLTSKIDDLKRKSGFTEKEAEFYKLLLNRLASLERRKKFIETAIEHASHIRASAMQKSNSLYEGLRRQIFAEKMMPKQSKFISSIFEVYDAELTEAIIRADEKVSKRTAHLPNIVAKLDEKISALELKVKPLADKFEDQKLITQLQSQQQTENSKIEKIEEISQKLRSIEEQGKETKTLIVDNYRELLDLYVEAVSEISNQENQPDNGLMITGEIELVCDVIDEFVNSFDRRGNIQELLGDLITRDGNYAFEQEQHVSNISEIFDRLKTQSPVIRKGITEEQVVKKLFTDCFRIQYKVLQNGDEITTMSPGKRGLVLLNLILHLSNSVHPILIDQPEDNLDNRTIYEQLNDYIRLRKVDRQIILVTHNANLVVASDAENVVVANQDGQLAGKDNKKYKFEYCSGAIENTFEKPESKGLLNQKGIRQHICEILEGGVSAFKERERKYGFSH